MKKILCTILILSVFALTSCGSGENSSTPSNDNSSSSSASTDSNITNSSSQNENSSNISSSNISSNSNTDVSANSSHVNSSFFDDAVFVGDSVTLKLSYYVDKARNNIGVECLGESKFLCSGSLGYANSMWNIDDSNSVHPSYQGEKYLIQDGVAAMNAKKVFIMLGVNDIAVYGIESTRDNAKKLIDLITDKNPDAEIYVQSVTPITQGRENGDYSNKTIKSFNELLKSLCDENGWKYLDIASIMTDENGYLKAEYCSDPDGLGIHFTDEACEKWIEYLETHVED